MSSPRLKSSLRYRILQKLCSMILPDSKQRMYEHYLRVREHVPSLAKETFALLHENYTLRKNHSHRYRVVSLGYDCFCRTLSTVYMLKKEKRAGEKSMIFDLAIHPESTVDTLLKNDFQDYFAGPWHYDDTGKVWYNDPEKGIFYPHDKDCNAAQLDKLQNRLKKRIDHFREIREDPAGVLFLLRKHKDSIPQDIQKLCRRIREARKGNPCTILILGCDHEDSCREIPGEDFVYLPYPEHDYVWFEPRMRYTPEGIAFELQLARICRERIRKLLETGP